MACIPALLVLGAKSALTVAWHAPYVLGGLIAGHAPSVIAAVKTYGLVHTAQTVALAGAGGLIMLGGATWTIEKIAALRSFAQSLRDGDIAAALATGEKLSAILDDFPDEDLSALLRDYRKPLDQFVTERGLVPLSNKRLTELTEAVLKEAKPAVEALVKSTG